MLTTQHLSLLIFSIINLIIAAGLRPNKTNMGVPIKSLLSLKMEKQML